MLSLIFSLLLSVLSASQRSFAERIYRQYHHILRRRCRRLLRDESAVDDVMQDIFWTICRKADGYRGKEEDILPWLYRVTTTHCLKLIEKNKRWSRNVEMAMEEGMERYHGSSGGMEHQVVANDLVMRLPPKQRQAVLYHFVSGMTQREIAAVMEVTRDQVRTWLAGFQTRSEAWRLEHGTTEADQGEKQ